MKTRIALTDANPEKRMEAIYNQFDKLGISSNPTLFRVSELYMSSTQNNRIGIVCDDVAEYKLRVNIGPGKYDYITLTKDSSQNNLCTAFLSRFESVVPFSVKLITNNTQFFNLFFRYFNPF